MTEVQFVRERRAAWDRWDATMRPARSRPASSLSTDDEVGQPIAQSELPAHFRALCLDLSLARERAYSTPLVESLQHRVLAAHQRVYGARGRRSVAWLSYFTGEFPALVRREWRAVLGAAALLFVPLLAQIAIVLRAPDAVYLVLPAPQVGMAEAMYAPDAAHLGRPPGASTEWMMWGLYVANNVRIDFQCFAGGIAFGLGSIFFLVYNGLIIGALAGHLTRIGYVETFWGFVAGHSSLELIGATLSGAAGLILGGALVSPGAWSRSAALVARGSTAVRLLYGAAMMTFLAAFVEAFWSPRREVPPGVKYVVGLLLWALLLAYFTLVGRRRAA